MSKIERSISPRMQQFFNVVNAGNSDYGITHIIDHCDEWIMEGWRIDMPGGPTAPMYAAALFNEANSQDKDVERGESDASYPILLRRLAIRILELDGHLLGTSKPTVEKSAIADLMNGG